MASRNPPLFYMSFTNVEAARELKKQSDLEDESKRPAGFAQE